MRRAGPTSSAGLNPGGEVLLAAGAIHSPQVLMASGVGPAEHLAEHGIDVVSDLPGVGSNLQDHPAVLSAFRFRDDAGRVSITDHIYDDDANIKPLQVRPLTCCAPLAPCSAVQWPELMGVVISGPVEVLVSSMLSLVCGGRMLYHLSRGVTDVCGRELGRLLERLSR